MTEQPRTCRACGAPNRARRELCAGCGADLDSGRVPPRPVRREAPDPPVVEPAPRRHARWVAAAIGALILAALLLLGLTLAGFGPLASEPSIPAAAFDEASYPADPEELELSDIATLTIAAGADVEAPAAMADDDPTTAWRSEPAATDRGVGADGEELHETIELVLEQPSWVERLTIANGDQLDGAAYAESARLARIRVTFDGNEVVVVELLDQGLGAQEVVFPDPLLTTVVRIEILEAFEGRTDELAVSEIGLAGWPAVGDDVAIAEERASLEPASPVARPGPVEQLSLRTRRG